MFNKEAMTSFVATLPDTHRKMLANALEHQYYVAREEYADGSGEASAEQTAVAEMRDAAIAAT